jgi:uncharacterized phage protein (TIGR01671 family)
MQDRFKFRVYDDGKMVYFGQLVNVGITSPLMQCTGLKDKNGKLIYEGDIIQENWHKYILEWGNGAYVIKDIKRGTSYMFTSGICKHKSEVIGNIYENPELLEVSSDH